MKLFACPSCGLVVFFGNVSCERCGVLLGYDPDANRMRARKAGEAATWEYCGNRAHDVCNWIVPAGSAPDALCRACRHNVTIPDRSDPDNVPRWRRLEEAKHRLLYTVLRLGLPLFDRSERADGLGFQFPRTDDGSVRTGHADGLVTIALLEADDAEREKRRTSLGEPYRTLLGHFRHEVGHWYWNLLVRDTPARADFTALFGDADLDYAAALERHYDRGPPADWPEHFISSYASAHPWEDFAETWAHYFHIVDTLESARAFGISVRPRVAAGAELATTISFDPHKAKVGLIIDAWTGLSIAVNEINRSMGMPDLYPFVLAPAVAVKLTFIHDCIHA
jgi:hypothetical protein